MCRYVHIGESHRGYLGTGSVPWEPFWRGLVEMGYTGPLTFESFSSAVASKSLSTTLCVWRDLCARLPLRAQPALPLAWTMHGCAICGSMTATA